MAIDIEQLERVAGAGGEADVVGVSRRWLAAIASEVRESRRRAAFSPRTAALDVGPEVLRS